MSRFGTGFKMLVLIGASVLMLLDTACKGVGGEDTSTTPPGCENDPTAPGCEVAADVLGDVFSGDVTEFADAQPSFDMTEDLESDTGRLCLACDDGILVYWDLGQSGAAPVVLVSDDSSVPRYALRGTFSAAAPQMASGGAYELQMMTMGGARW